MKLKTLRSDRTVDKKIHLELDSDEVKWYNDYTQTQSHVKQS